MNGLKKIYIMKDDFSLYLLEIVWKQPLGLCRAQYSIALAVGIALNKHGIKTKTL